MSTIEFQTRPIDQWPGPLTPANKRKRARFACPYGTINADLYRELEHLQAKGVALLMALSESDIRLDGRPRAGVKPAHPGVIVTCETKHGPMRWACDSFLDWTQNLRAISLTLKNLRLVDEYGCTKRGEQYKGFARLTGPNGAMTREQALSLVERLTGTKPTPTSLPLDQLLRQAEMKTHPDKGGNPEDFKRVQSARAVLLGA